MKRVQFCILLTSIFLFSACIEIKKQEFSPKYACPGDDIRMEIKLSRKADYIKVIDQNGKELKHKKRTKKLNYTVHDIAQDQFPLSVKMYKQRDFWRNWGKTIVAPIEIFPTEEWSSGVETVEIQVRKDIGSRTYEESGENCECVKWKKEDNTCLEEKCEPYTNCITEYTFTYTPQRIKWQLPDWNYSGQIKVAGVRNTSPYPITLNINSDEFQLNPEDEKFFPHSEIRDLAIASEIPAEFQQSSECGILKRCCDGEKCYGYIELHEEDYPEPMECFPELKTAVQLFLVCEGQGIKDTH